MDRKQLLLLDYPWLAPLVTLTLFIIFIQTVVNLLGYDLNIAVAAVDLTNELTAPANVWIEGVYITYISPVLEFVGIL